MSSVPSAWRRLRRTRFQVGKTTTTSLPPLHTSIEVPTRLELHYEPLDDQAQEIRLLGIRPEDSSGDLHCTLSHFSCIETLYPPYTALSYCWGDTGDPATIVVNGFNVPVTKNLELALRELQRRGKDWVWVDALCINQKDQDEMGHQILRMRGVYRNAIETISWLGPDRNGSAQHAFELLVLLAIQKPEEIFEEAIDALFDASNTFTQKWKALREMMGLPYWQRTWIIQEVVLSRSVKIWWGRDAVDLKTLRESMYELRACKIKSGFAKGYQNIMSILRIMNMLEGNVKTSQMDLQTALRYSCSSQATEPRDKIFGILGLSNDGSDLIPSPDYRQPLEDILRDITIKRLKQGNGSPAPGPMDLICIDNPKVPRRDDLPSWVIDWRGLWRSQEGSLRSSRTLRGLKSEYRACGDSLAAATFSDDGSILIVSGFIFDTIHGLSDRAVEKRDEVVSRLEYYSSDTNPVAELTIENNIYGSEAKLYEAIWRSLVQDRTAEHTVKAPAIFGAHFRHLWSNHGQEMTAKRAKFIRANISVAGDFSIYGRTLREWSFPTSISAITEAFARDAQMSSPGDADPEDFEDFVRALKFPLMRRRVMTTTKGYVGLAHCQANIGDTICLLKGCSMPTILRKYEDDWKVVGEAYFHGIMNGEFWEVQDENEMQDFHIR
ncbi:uncharacterized protein PAC_16927 [Phialocephala subalpina]|uniref:Heterokaryon incompatibility domain-containing protein n=1 Tax=Phialocephala subalpina TaxID=576137 RepID=A0A1L7XPY3_9HELO|nr:uncharacterized protein PAC_16927 [Phialocephala subalpina]